MTVTPMSMRLAEVVHTITVEDILEKILQNDYERFKVASLHSGDMLTISHDYGSFQLTADEAKDMLATLRLRGKVK